MGKRTRRLRPMAPAAGATLTVVAGTAGELLAMLDGDADWQSDWSERELSDTGWLDDFAQSLADDAADVLGIPVVVGADSRRASGYRPVIMTELDERKRTSH